MDSNIPFDDLFRSLSSGSQTSPEAMTALAVLLSETLRFRDRLKEESGYVLTVHDTREALNALEDHLHGRTNFASLTSEQSELARIYISRLTTFS